MHIAIKKQKQYHHTPTKNDTQQKRHALMPFKSNGTLQKWYMTNFPPEIEKFDTHKKWCLT